MSERSAIPITSRLSIPMAELSFRFVRSSGPGGQHVNKTATQVELLFDVAHSPSLSNAQRHRLLAALRSHISNDGLLRLCSQSTRSQHRNREDAIQRFRRLVISALHVPKARRPTKPTRGSVKRRLDSKRRHS
ncbi:aminoacyl-tRNA hydrolase, partial [bacterium]|nr:aminoacyl-tRNA hydrolase [bacterium]